MAVNILPRYRVPLPLRQCWKFAEIHGMFSRVVSLSPSLRPILIAPSLSEQDGQADPQPGPRPPDAPVAADRVREEAQVEVGRQDRELGLDIPMTAALRE